MSTWSYNGQAGPSTTDFATQTELDDAVATVNTALAAKQASSTAATDVELASAVADLEALLADKADSGDVATDIAAAISAHAAGDASDAELASAVASLTTSIATKQDASTASTDAERDAHMASGTLAARPAAATYGVGFYYATDEALLYYSNGSTWVLSGSSGVEIDYVEIAATPGDSSHVNATTSFVAVTGLGGLVVPAGTRPVKLRYGAMGSNNTTNGGIALAIYDESNVIVPGSARQVFAPGTNGVTTLTGEARLDAPAAQHTYHLRLRAVTTGTVTLTCTTASPVWLEAVTR